jgi:hypothetical protein
LELLSIAGNLADRRIALLHHALDQLSQSRFLSVLNSFPLAILVPAFQDSHKPIRQQP